jgi:hypothetical protein
MTLDSFDCELCLLQREVTLRHLFFKCSFAKNCWSLIGINVPSWLRPEHATRHIKRQLKLPFSMDIIILMYWSIWSERNSWLFSNEDPHPLKCKEKFAREFALVIHRAKKSLVPQMQSWLSSLIFFLFLLVFCSVLCSFPFFIILIGKKLVGELPLLFHQKNLACESSEEGH